ncbi:type I secretion outer membrane protein, TolC family [Oleidesulfovibrio alaskensis G20]|jgi:adhesin transport system outer membrane protein|uniref:Type I secretion outer membrane protein, TolC family n=2 Tax=Oleidesulfovibrio alaskensis TaxID=58180 RepID=Q312D2_OLEA2|nr:type I secretion outer membrane protein, TolC family [Oleidesulfovibrio alaskensis G20]
MGYTLSVFPIRWNIITKGSVMSHTCSPFLSACKNAVLLSAAGVFMLSGQAFAGTSLQQSVEATLKNNPVIKSFKEGVSAAKHDVRDAEGGWFPRLDFNAGYGVEQVNDALTRTDGRKNHWEERSDITTTLSQLLWDGGKVNSQIGIQEARLANADSRLTDNAEVLALEAIRAHLELYRQRNLVLLAEQNVKNHEDILKSQEERQRMGATSLADVSQTKGRLARAQASLSNARQELLVAEANYRRIAGTDAPEVDWADKPAGVPGTFDSALQLALTSNPKLAAQQAEIQENEQRIQLARSEYYPTFTAQASNTYKDQVESSTTWEVDNALQLRVSWNIFRGGSDLAAEKAEGARKRRSMMDLQNINEALMQETSDTWNALENAREQKRLFNEAVEYNTQTRDMYIEQFSVGQRSLLDVLDAENELYSSSIQLVTATVNEIVAEYRLVALGGKLIETVGLDPAIYKQETAEQNS